ncbi:MAG: hypothetical protein U0800_01100 [Isosphaeraceae bacterium]
MIQRTLRLFAAGITAALFAGCQPDPAPVMTFPPGTVIPAESKAKAGGPNSGQSQGDPSSYSQAVK